jgi:hypothetical protein
MRSILLFVRPLHLALPILLASLLLAWQADAGTDTLYLENYQVPALAGDGALPEKAVLVILRPQIDPQLEQALQRGDPWNWAAPSRAERHLLRKAQIERLGPVHHDFLLIRLPLPWHLRR